MKVMMKGYKKNTIDLKVLNILQIKKNLTPVFPVTPVYIYFMHSIN